MTSIAADQVQVPVDEVRALCASVLVTHGQSPAEAAAATDVLVRTTARGYRSHGVELLPLYVSWMSSGAIVGGTTPEVVHRTSTTAVVDARGGMGQVSSAFAMVTAGDLAAEHGLGMVVVRGSNHAGALGHYALLAAERGLIGLAWSSAPPIMHAPGSAGRLIGNGPTAYGVPRRGQPPLVFDAAMSIGSGGKAALARDRGEELPEGWLLDAGGAPSVDPADVHTGSLAPVGEHKGFALALLAEVLSSCLSGALLSQDLPAMHPPPPAPFGMGHAFLAVDGAAFGADLAGQAALLSDSIRGAPDREDAEGVRTPGDRAHEREVAAARDGIGFDTATWARLQALTAG
jgi:LDH2 family malate/lactate/ureidoglycolate dehydrogenase